MSTILLLSSLLDAQAAGFTLAGEGTRPMGRAGAAVVGVDDLSAIRTNPAAVIRFARPQVNLQLAAAHQRVRFTRSGEAPVSNEAGPQLIPNLGYANGIIPGKLSFAVGLVSPLGAPLAYPEDGPQRFTQVESTLRSGEVGAVLAWRPIEGLSVGAGVSWTFLWLEQSLVS
ncbi:MAG: outer membrane protein transport protein, partial [Myxococcota bacterium]